MTKKGMLALLLLTTSLMANSRPVEMQAGGMVVKVEFYTPSIVRIVKSPSGHPYSKESLVVTARPEETEVSQKGNRISSNLLTVSIDQKTGALTFTANGRTLLREKSACTFEPRTEGPDAGAYRVTQTFQLDKDEAIYGLGTIQNGRMNRRGEHKLMEQSNLEDFQNVLQSIKGWGLFWDNYSRTQFDDDARQGMSFSSEVGHCADYYFMYSILPLGPEMQYVGEKRWDVLDIRLYPGADGEFTLYEDEGDNYNYEKGIYATIPFHWNDKARTLTIGNRQGSYPGMLTSRQFRITLPDGTAQTVSYQGAATTVAL